MRNFIMSHHGKVEIHLFSHNIFHFLFKVEMSLQFAWMAARFGFFVAVISFRSLSCASVSVDWFDGSFWYYGFEDFWSFSQAIWIFWELLHNWNAVEQFHPKLQSQFLEWRFVCGCHGVVPGFFSIRSDFPDQFALVDPFRRHSYFFVWNFSAKWNFAHV